jgi:hypothetical protein
MPTRGSAWAAGDFFGLGPSAIDFFGRGASTDDFLGPWTSVGIPPIDSNWQGKFW